jgi:hypothetical protein
MSRKPDCRLNQAQLLLVGEVLLRREGKFWVYRGGDAPAPVDMAGMIVTEREARSEAILPGSTALPSMEENAEA